MRKAHVLTYLVIVGGLCASIVACDEQSTQDGGTNLASSNCDPTATFDAFATVEMTVEDVLVPAYADFKIQLTALNNLIQSLPSEPAQSDLTDLSEAYRQTFLSWQKIDALQLGPVGRSTDLKGGQGMRDFIYSFDLFRACTIDNNIVSQAYEDESTFDITLDDTTGLLALEYLIFSPPEMNACSSAAPINREGTFDSIPASEKRSRRAAYMKALSNNLIDRFELLEAAFNTYKADVLNTGLGSELFPCPKDVLSDIYIALFYFERILKDRKLGAPLGEYEPCEDAKCPEGVEGRYSRLGSAAAWTNIETFETIFFGDDITGFDAWLSDIGQDVLVTSLRTTFDEAKSTCGFLNEPNLNLAQLIENDDSRVRDCYDDLSAFTRFFKTDVPSQLGLLPPMEAAADTD